MVSKGGLLYLEAENVSVKANQELRKDTSPQLARSLRISTIVDAKI